MVRIQCFLRAPTLLASLRLIPIPLFLCYLDSPSSCWGSGNQHNPARRGKWHGTAKQHDAVANREQWLSPPVYPHATKQFYEMFENDDSQYDGVYAMLASTFVFH